MQPETALAPTPTFLDLYRFGLEQGKDAAELSKLLEVYERMEAKKAEREYNEAFRRVQERIPPLVTDKKGQNNMYVRLETIQEVITPIVRSQGFTISTTEANCPKEGHIRVVTTLAHSGGHKTEHFGDFPVDGAGAKGGGVMNAIQGNGSSIHYARRYILCMIFNLTVVGQDNDGANPNRCIDEGQEQVIRKLIDDCASASKPVDLPKMYAFMSTTAKRPVKHLSELPSHVFDQIVTFLNNKRGAKK